MAEREMPIVEQKESIKLTKGMTGKYSWELKLVDNEDIDKQIERLDRINNKLVESYGQKEDSEKIEKEVKKKKNEKA